MPTPGDITHHLWFPKDTEKRVWVRLRNALLRELGTESFHVERIENTCTRGMADCCGVWQGREFWFELKVARSATERVKFQPGQVGWLTRRCKLGSRAFILVARRGHVLELYWGADAYRLSRAEKVDPLWTHVGPMKGEDWRELAHQMAVGA